MNRLNLGCGHVQPEGWVNADTNAQLDDDDGIVIIDDPAHRGLPWPDETFDGAVAHHVLQMVAWPDLVPWLAEVRRVLKPEGVLRLSVPHLLSAVNAYHENDASWFPIDDSHEPTVDGKLCMYLSQAGATRSVFTGRWLMELLGRAGFARSLVSYPLVHASGPPDYFTFAPPWLLELDSRHAESLFVEGQR